MAVEIRVYASPLTPEGVEAERAAREASRRLYTEYGILAVVDTEPIWCDPITSSALDLPVVSVNGVVVAKGRAPSPEEVIDTTLSVIFENKRGCEEVPLHVLQRPHVLGTAEETT